MKPRCNEPLPGCHSLGVRIECSRAKGHGGPHSFAVAWDALQWVVCVRVKHGRRSIKSARKAAGQ